VRRLLIIACLLGASMAGAAEVADSLQVAPAAVKVHGDFWFARDKGDHFLVSAFLTGAGYYAARSELNASDPASLNLAAGFSLSMGIGKEVYDKYKRGGLFSWKDLGADVLGIGLGYLLCAMGRK